MAPRSCTPTPRSATPTAAPGGGHLNQGCLVFSLEVRLEELDGNPPVRVPDPVTGLALWDLTP